MFEPMTEVRRTMEHVAAGFDPAVLSASECAAVVRDASVVERLAAMVKSLAAARVAQTDVWRRGGDRSAAHALARETGTSVKSAIDALEVGEKLGSLPSLDAAARRGEVSASQAALIAGAANDDVAAGRLVATATKASLGELRDECLRTKAAGVGADERHRRIKESRRLRTWIDGEGAWNLTMRDVPEVGAEVMAVVQPIRDRLFREARRAGRREPSEAYAADAMVEVARRAAGSSSQRSAPAKVVVRVDWDALVRGWPIEGEACDIAGLGPVPVSMVRAMIDSGDAFLAAVATKGKDVVNVAHLGRRATAFQQTALEWSSPTCTALGCNAVANVQTDHRVDWSQTKITLLAWLDRLCSHHHDLKTHDGWALVPGVGKREMVPPGEERHPGGMRAYARRSRAGPLAAAS